MKFTSQQNLPCLDGTDMSAVALYMKCFAEQVEASLVETTDEFNSFLRAPAAIWAINNQTLVTEGQVIFAGATSINWPTVPVFGNPALPNLRGWYYIGANVFLTDPTPTVNTDRSITLSATQTAGIISGNGVLAQFQDTSLETNTGGEVVLPAGTVFFAGGDFTAPNPVSLALTYRQGIGGVLNSVDIPVNPPSQLWIVYLGDTPQIGVI